MSKPIEVDHLRYHRTESAELRQAVIKLRDSKLSQWPLTIDETVLLSFVIAWMSVAIERLFPE